jgi:hypothetical protein
MYIAGAQHSSEKTVLLRDMYWERPLVYSLGIGENKLKNMECEVQ